MESPSIYSFGSTPQMNQGQHILRCALVTTLHFLGHLIDGKRDNMININEWQTNKEYGLTMDNWMVKTTVYTENTFACLFTVYHLRKPLYNLRRQPASKTQVCPDIKPNRNGLVNFNQSW